MVLCESEDAKSENDALVAGAEICPEGSLTAQMFEHLAKERVSFHTPGHKGRSQSSVNGGGEWQSTRLDLTELPGLDDLSHPTGPLLELENRIARVFGAESSLISCNGASAGIVAATLLVAQRGSAVLVPRNCHRAIVNGLVLSGLNPVWYEPFWDCQWGLWGAVELASLEAAIERELAHQLTAVWVVSPTYGGTISPIGSIANLCHKHNLPLIVDEAHGAQLLTEETVVQSALANGADIVVHSFHKHLGALTQTGAVHLGLNGVQQFGFEKEELRSHLNLVQSTSPSYLLLRSIDAMVTSLENGDAQTAIEKVTALSLKLRQTLLSQPGVLLYEPQSNLSPFHILFRLCGRPIDDVQKSLSDAGIFAETTLGEGILLMLGIGSTDSDLQALEEVLAASIDPAAPPVQSSLSLQKPEPITQVLGPREASLAPCTRISKFRTIGLVAAECVAPCPPGWPLLVPGQMIGEQDVKNLHLDSLRVVIPPIK
jgi:arginine decarboxylase